MDTEIYYFSGSGNSLHVARELQKRLPQSDLIPLVGLVEQPSVVSKAECVGFVFPLHGWQMPGIVAKMIQKIDLASARYIFAITTRGGTPCRAFLELSKILEKKGETLDANFVLTMPASSQSLLKNFTSIINDDRVTRLENEMLTRLNEIQKIILARQPSLQESLDGIDMPPIIKLLEPLFLLLAREAENTFVFYSDSKCTGCGLCEKMCLASKIKMAAGKPIWQKSIKCYNCYSCLNYCPEQAVQLESTWFMKSYTPQNGRYHHTQITPADIIKQKG